MIKVTIEQSRKYNDGYVSTEEITGVFDDPVKAMPFLSEFMQHFQYKKMVIEPVEVETVELIEEEEG